LSRIERSRKRRRVADKRRDVFFVKRKRNRAFEIAKTRAFFQGCYRRSSGERVAFEKNVLRESIAGDLVSSFCLARLGKIVERRTLLTVKKEKQPKRRNRFGYYY
jgi:hypothetical protein